MTAVWLGPRREQLDRAIRGDRRRRKVLPAGTGRSIELARGVRPAAHRLRKCNWRHTKKEAPRRRATACAIQPFSRRSIAAEFSPKYLPQPASRKRRECIRDRFPAKSEMKNIAKPRPAGPRRAYVVATAACAIRRGAWAATTLERPPPGISRKTGKSSRADGSPGHEIPQAKEATSSNRWALRFQGGESRIRRRTTSIPLPSHVPRAF